MSMGGGGFGKIFSSFLPPPFNVLMGGSDDKLPTPSAPPPAPSIETPDVQKAAEDERKRLLAARSRAANEATGGRGIAGPAPTATQQLLGL